MTSRSKDNSSRQLEVLELMLVFFRKHRLVELSLIAKLPKKDLLLSLAEETALLSIEQDPNMTVKDVAVRHKIERSWMSRIISKLELAGFLKSQPGASDLRSKNLRVTAKGKAALNQTTSIAIEVLELGLKRLSAQQRSKLEQAYKALADNLSEPDFAQRDNSDPVFHHLLRIGRAIGFYSEKFMGSELNLNQFLVLQALWDRRSSDSLLGDLQHQMPFDLSTVSRTVAAFEAAGLVTKRTAPQDRRGSLVQISADGIKKFEGFRKSADTMMRQALASFSTGEINELIDILNRIIEGIPDVQRQGPASRPEIRELSKGKMDFPDAIERQIGLLARKQSDDKMNSFGMYVGDTLRAVARIGKAKGQNSERDIILLGENLSRREILAFLRSCMR